MPLLETKGAGSAQGFGEFSSSTPAVYIEDVFSTYLYAGNGSTQTITNGIDLSTKGGLVWSKDRGATVTYSLFDTARGASKTLSSADANQQGSNSSPYVPTFLSNGFETSLLNNENAHNFVSWTFRKQPKFFDVVTYTGNDTSRSIAHNLGSVPGCIIIKCTTSAGFDWVVYHRSNGATKWMKLNATDAVATNATYFPTVPTSTTFEIGAGGLVNSGGDTFVAYLFAHDAGGFGLSGTDNVISCGSFTTDGSGNATVSLGYEPQWVLIKYNSNDSWRLFDNMRGMSQTNWVELYPNTSNAEVNRTNQTDLFVRPNATGFTTTWSPQASRDAIYIAIRRGPMKVPTSGTSVFNTMLVTGNGTNERQITGVGFPPDLLIGKRTSTSLIPLWFDKLRGKERYLDSSSTSAETALAAGNEGLMLQDGFVIDNNYGSLNVNGSTYADWVFRRAPGFFDVVCYTGTGANRTVSHNLAAVPELMIVKNRNFSAVWTVYSAALGNTGVIYLNDSDIAYYSATYWNSTTPTSSVFSLGTSGNTNGGAGQTYVAYLFATCPGVSKVGSYTGTGTTKQIDCGFTGGARFILIKRTDSTGDWYVYDTARGIVSGNDSYLFLNSTAAEVTNTDYVDTYSAGFELSSTAPAGLNANGGTFVFFAVA